jgi:hypothetical protein
LGQPPKRHIYQIYLRMKMSNGLISRGISGFLDFIHRTVFEGTRRFGNWICFHPQVKRGKKTPTQLGLLERANLNHWIDIGLLNRPLSELFKASVITIIIIIISRVLVNIDGI